jgi:membrane fusion protein (multidrug efflux system)
MADVGAGLKVGRGRPPVWLALPFALLVPGCEQAEPPAPPALEVVVAKVVQQDVPIYGEWVGTTEGFVNAQIRPQVEGYLLKRHYREGSVVQEGDPLFEIDPRQFQAILNQARGSLGEAQAGLGKATLDVDRYTALIVDGAVSQQELDDATQAKLRAQASVLKARAEVEQARLNLAWTKIVSPIAGVAGISKGQVGDLVAPSTVLTTVSQLDPIKVSFPISEQEYLFFRRRAGGADPRAERREERGLELILADGSTYEHRGRLEVVGREVDAQTGTIQMEGYFENPGNLLRPGQFAKIRAVVRHEKGALLVPQRAVNDTQGTYQVAVVQPDSTVAVRAVEVGDRSGNLWVIRKGVEAGEQVIVEGIQKVRGGMTVRPVTAKAKADAQDAKAKAGEKDTEAKPDAATPPSPEAAPPTGES